MTRIAAIDLGTNSFLCLICELDRDLKILEDICRVVRLGEKVAQNKFFLPQALGRAEEAFQAFKILIDRYQVQRVVATATSAARDVANGQELIKLGLKYKIPISIIDGDLEANLSFEGTVSGLPDMASKSLLVLDVGGGSTEFIFRKSHSPGITARSFDIGCVRQTEMFITKDPLDPLEYKALVLYAKEKFLPFKDLRPDLTIAVAGTPTTLVCLAEKMEFDMGKIEGYKLSLAKIKEMAAHLGALPLAKRKLIKELDPLRADVIVAGCGILSAGMETIGTKEIQVSTRGLRFGTALRYMEF